MEGSGGSDWVLEVGLPRRGCRLNGMPPRVRRTRPTYIASIMDTNSRTPNPVGPTTNSSLSLSDFAVPAMSM